MIVISRLASASFGGLALFLVVAASASTACSGANDAGVNEPAPAAKESGLPCCHGAYIYRCASESALKACSDSSRDETTDCTKTTTTCGGTTAPTPSGTTPPPSTPDASPPPKPKQAVGEKCSIDIDCSDNLCLVFGSGTAGFCSKTCATAANCPSRYRCELAEKLGSKVCVPMGEKRIGETCTYNLDCDSNLCLTSGTATLGYCTAQCSVPAECPTTWACAPVGGASGKFCTRP